MSCGISQPTCLILPPFLLPSPPLLALAPLLFSTDDHHPPPSFVSVTYALRLNDASIYRQSQFAAYLDPEAPVKDFGGSKGVCYSTKDG